MPEKNIKYIVRILNTDLNGKLPIAHSMMKIKGVKFMFANAVCKLAGVENTKKTGELTDKEIENINKVLINPSSFNMPDWMLNRNMDYETGNTMHLYNADLDYTKMNDIKRMQKIKSYKGLRHAAHLPVRGQKTKSNFRKGKSLGVSKKKK